jgi:hypothetical protein
VSRAALRPQHRSVQLTQNRTGATKATKRANRQRASWLKEVKKVKRVEESEKWVTRPRGGEVKKNFEKERIKMIGEKKNKKT